MFSITAIGTIGQIKSRETSNGTYRVEGRIASDRGSKDNKETDWLNFKAFDKTARNIEKFFKQGYYAIFSGGLQTETYPDKEGKNVTKYVMIVDRFAFPRSTKKEETEQATTSPQFTQGFTEKEQPGTFQPGAFNNVDFSEIPF